MILPSASTALTLFLLTPLREGRPRRPGERLGHVQISTHAPAGGATLWPQITRGSCLFLLTPLREGRRKIYYKSENGEPISTHAPAGGATYVLRWISRSASDFYSRPCGRGDSIPTAHRTAGTYFYSRPCGRGDLVALLYGLA